jgi:hypothetical protein
MPGYLLAVGVTAGPGAAGFGHVAEAPTRIRCTLRDPAEVSRAEPNHTWPQGRVNGGWTDRQWRAACCPRPSEEV